MVYSHIRIYNLPIQWQFLFIINFRIIFEQNSRSIDSNQRILMMMEIKEHSEDLWKHVMAIKFLISCNFPNSPFERSYKSSNEKVTVWIQNVKENEGYCLRDQSEKSQQNPRITTIVEYWVHRSSGVKMFRHTVGIVLKTVGLEGISQKTTPLLKPRYLKTLLTLINLGIWKPVYLKAKTDLADHHNY